MRHKFEAASVGRDISSLLLRRVHQVQVFRQMQRSAGKRAVESSGKFSTECAEHLVETTVCPSPKGTDLNQPSHLVSPFADDKKLKVVKRTASRDGLVRHSAKTPLSFVDLQATQYSFHCIHDSSEILNRPQHRLKALPKQRNNDGQQIELLRLKKHKLFELERQFNATVRMEKMRKRDQLQPKAHFTTDFKGQKIEVRGGQLKRKPLRTEVTSRVREEREEKFLAENDPLLSGAQTPLRRQGGDDESGQDSFISPVHFSVRDLGKMFGHNSRQEHFKSTANRRSRMRIYG